MADWNSLLDDPLFNAGLGLLGGAATPNPWGVAADQLNRYQTLRQNRELQKMHSKLYEAQAIKAKSEAEQEAAARAARDRVRANITDPKELDLFDTNPSKWVEFKLKGPEYKVVGRSLIDPSKPEQPLYRDPEAPPTEPEFIRLLRAQGVIEGSPQWNAEIAQYRRKLQTHAPAPMAISYGSPIPMLNKEKGEIEYVQPGNRAGAPPQVMSGYTRPPPDPTAPKDPTEDMAKTQYNISRVVSSAKQLKGVPAKEHLPSGREAAINALVPGDRLAETLINQSATTNRQIARAAQGDAVDALLYLATGAAYNEEQAAAARRAYIPQYGDKPDTIKAKKQRFNSLIKDAKVRSARAWTPELDEAVQELTKDSFDAAPSSGGWTVKKVR